MKKLADYILALNKCLEETTISNDRKWYQMYLADAGLMLAKLANGKDIRDEIESHERLLGNSWLEDEKSHKFFYKLWADFKETYPKK